MSQHDLRQIYNFLPISDIIATSGQPTSEQFNHIDEAGFRTVINLALPTSTNALPNEAEIFNNLGLNYIHIPVVWEEPSLSDLKKFFQAMDEHSNRSTFIHCAANMRVSAFMYLYHRIRQQMNDDEAKRYLYQIWMPNKTWQAFIDRALQSFH